MMVVVVAAMMMLSEARLHYGNRSLILSYQPFAWYSWSPASKKSLLKLEAGCCDMATGSGCCFNFVMSCVVCRRFKAFRLPLLRC